jgi:DNA modification methylase
MKYEIILGDCELKLKEILDSSIHLTWTSPPYYNAKSYSQWPTYDEYLIFLQRANRNSESKRLPIPFHFFSIMEKIGWKYLEDIVWVKPEGSAINRNGGFFQHRKPVAYKPNLVSETIFVFQKPANFLIDKIVRSYSGDTLKESLVTEEYERSNVWYINPETHSKHLAPYPEELSDKIVKYYSFVGDMILDPFLGSGTTLLSAKKLNRDCLGIELHQEYIDMSIKRLEDYDKKNSQIRIF